ncbi:MAG: DUF1624 domain-containing protein [Lachnospiraceae bacterium]|nr:DUF1624 domain-containing protein [Lachnospiraceae bacterium]
MKKWNLEYSDRKRLARLDGIRGIALLNMITYHTIWDLVYLYQVDWNWYKSEGAYIWQQGICWTFLFLSGFCWSLGSRTWKRGITVFLGGAIITLVTLIAMPQNRVFFGVLTLTGSSMLLMNVIDRWLCKLPSAAGMAVSGILFFLMRNVNEGYLGFEKWNFAKIPGVFYRNLFTAYLGFPQKGFYSTDYFSIFPWVFLFMAGYFTFRYLNEKKRMHFFEKSVLWPVEWLGKHSFEIYMVHQPVIYAVLELIFLVRGKFG